MIIHKELAAGCWFAAISHVGDWEIDTIIGKNHIGAFVSMVDRASN